MQMSIRQQKYVSLTVSAVSDLMSDTLRSLGRPDFGVERDEVIRVLQLGLDEIQLLWSELRSRSEDLAGGGDSLTELFELAPDAYLITEGDGTICHANRMAAQLMETSSGELRARRLEAFVRREDRDALVQRLKCVSRRRDCAWHGWWGTLHFLDGSDLEVEFRVRGFYPRHGGELLYYWLLRSASLSARA